MAQQRNLVPLSIYLHKEAVEEADQRAADLGIATATLLRLILYGHEEPLAAVSSGR